MPTIKKYFLTVLLILPLIACARPNAPSELKLKATSETTISISWKDNSEDESGFKIYRDNLLIHTTKPNIEYFKDKGLSPRTKYKYTVKATNDNGFNYYISPNGNDLNIGSINAPFKTIQHAADLTSPGDTVYLREGIYTGVIRVTKSGSKDGGYITYTNYNNENAIITRNDTDYYRNTFCGENVSYIKVIGLKFENCLNDTLIFTTYPKEIENNKEYNGSSHIIIKDNEIYEQNSKAPEDKREGHALIIKAHKDYPINYITIDNNQVHHNHTGKPESYDESLTILGNVNYFKIINNKIHDNDFIGLDIIGHQKGNFSIFGMNSYGYIANNTIYQNGIRKEWAEGLYIDGTQHTVIEKNKIYNNYCAGITISQEIDNSTTDYVLVRNNLIINNRHNGFGAMSNKKTTVNNSIFIHNSVVNKKTTFFYLGFGENNIIKNNIFYNINQHDNSIFKELQKTNFKSWIFDHNAYLPISSTEEEKDKNSIDIDTISFIDMENFDFRLTDNSQAIDVADFLTQTINSGEGNIIEVYDTRFFTDGAGIFEADTIIIGDNKPIKIISINHETSEVIVNQTITWKSNDKVSYIYSGKQPDIGAYEK